MISLLGLGMNAEILSSMIVASTGGAAEVGFGQVLLRTLPIALVAFFVSGYLLYSLWRSLAEESASGEVRFSARSRRRMMYLVISLIVFGLIFGWMAFRAP